VIDAVGGPIVLAGQAVRSRAEWEGSTSKMDSGRPDAADGEIYDASVARLRSLEPARVHFAHDDAVWSR
jgi:hypothetical protein